MSRGKGSNLNVETLKEEIQVKLVFPFRYLGEKFASSFLGLQFGVKIG